VETTDWVRIVATAAAGIPVGWFGALLVDRVPDALSLRDPRPAIPFPSEDSRRRDIVVYVLTIICFALGGATFEEIVVLVPYLVFFAAVVALSVIDIQTLRLPDRLVFPTFFAGAILLPIASIATDRERALLYAAIGSVFYFGFLFVAHMAYPPGMGFGDVKLSLVLGLFLGWLAGNWTETLAIVLYAMLGGFVLGSIVGVGVLVSRGRSAGYPFGPFLALGAVAVALVSDHILDLGS
jgi:leader peptidase (prepilin peptidase) / N-methyltransferase